MDVYLEHLCPRQVHSANNITLVHPTLHPDRVLREHDFLYMLDGSWEVHEEEQTHVLHRDDLLILAAGRHHYGSALSSLQSRHMYIHTEATPEELRRNCSGMPQPGVMPSADSASGTVFRSVIHCRNNPGIRRRFEEIISVCLEKPPHCGYKLSLLMSLLLCELEEQQYNQKDASAYSITEEIIRLLQTTPQRFFTGRELGELFFVSERTLNNYFKKTVGKTLYTYQMEMKLEMVRRFLVDQAGSKLHEVALDFGFYDEFHLSKAFKKKYGVSPQGYRQRGFEKDGLD